MPPFDFISAPKIIFGKGRIARLKSILTELGSNVFLIHNASSPGVLETVKKSIGQGSFFVGERVQRGEPTVADVDATARAARAAGCNLIVGLGGGSAMDCAKAAACLLTNRGSAIDYLEVVGGGNPVTKRSAPWVAIPTTAGTGAEVTRNAVLGVLEKRFKASMRSELMMAHVALVDPELGMEVRAAVTARCGMDAVCQLIESYTSTLANAMTDALALRGLESAARSLRRVYADGSDVEAREEMALAALLSGITLTNAGLGAAHGFAAPMGALYPAPHGTVCGALLAPVIEENVAALRKCPDGAETLKRYAAVGRILSARPELADAEAIDAGVESARALCRELRIESLGTFGLKPAGFGELIALARKSSSMKFNPVELSQGAMERILAAACGAD